VRLHFWFLLVALFDTIDILRATLPAYFIALNIGVMLAVVLFHELGHRVFARRVGGDHWEWVLWPLGGMVAPTSPRTPGAVFTANVGGPVFTLALGLACLAGALLIPGSKMTYALSFDPFNPLGFAVLSPMPLALNFVLSKAVAMSAAVFIINLFPCYWFDGGHLWQAILWPKLGAWKATMVTCMAGMIGAVPFFFLALVFGGPALGRLLGMIIWALIFADCFRRRQMLSAAGPGVMEDEDGPAYNYMDTQTPRAGGRKSLRRRWMGSALRKKAKADQAEQARIDAILAKVKEKGLHSLSWWEKRTLRKATERQRQQDLAERR
jgi:Zn-dependent protease